MLPTKSEPEDELVLLDELELELLDELEEELEELEELELAADEALELDELEAVPASASVTSKLKISWLSPLPMEPVSWVLFSPQ